MKKHSQFLRKARNRCIEWRLEAIKSHDADRLLMLSHIAFQSWKIEWLKCQHDICRTRCHTLEKRLPQLRVSLTESRENLAGLRHLVTSSTLSNSSIVTAILQACRQVKDFASTNLWGDNRLLLCIGVTRKSFGIFAQ
jgi:hypothetical protein